MNVLCEHCFSTVKCTAFRAARKEKKLLEQAWIVFLSYMSMQPKQIDAHLNSYECVCVIGIYSRKR